MAGHERVSEWVGLRVDDAYGARIGRVEGVYADTRGEPIWLLVRRGRFGDERALVPIAGAAHDDEAVRVPYERQAVAAAPPAPADVRTLTARAELALTLHYGVADRLPALRGAGGGAMTARLSPAALQQPVAAGF